MELREKVAEALRQHFNPDHIRLEDDEGISGVIVSGQFRGVTSLDRQTLIRKALRDSSVKLTPAELRKVVAIAALTPIEYESLGIKN
jgi:hypothetical protein